MAEAAVADKILDVKIHNPAEYAVTVPDHTLKTRINVGPGETKTGRMRAVDVDYHRTIGAKEEKLGRQYLRITTPAETAPPASAKKS